MADTLLQVVTDELASAQADYARLTGELVAAQTDLDAAQSALKTDVDAMKKLNEEAAAIRRAIAATTVAADGKALYDALEAKTSEIRSLQAEMLDQQEKLADGRSRVDTSRAAAGAAAAEISALTEARTAATTRDSTNTARETVATSAPLSNLPADAGTARTGPEQTAAQKRLDGSKGGDLPAELFTRAEERWKSQLDRLAAIDQQAKDAEDKRATEAAKSGFAGTTDQARIAFERAEAKLADFTLAATGRRDQALAMLTAVGNAAPLSADEKTRLGSLRDAAKTADAFKLEGLRDAARDKVAADVETTGTVPKADADALTKAEDDYTAAARDAMAALEAAIPDATWSLFAEYEEALTLLAGVAAIKPADDLKTPFDAAETPYAAALRAEQDNARTVAAADEVVRQTSDRAGTVAQIRSARLLQALRGND
jgi:hypothetical protein